MAHVVMVPGLGVRTYLEPSAEALREAGHQVDLRRAPAWRGEEVRLDAYGRRLAVDLGAGAEPVDLLIGASVGSQAAAVAAAGCEVGHLLLISPTVDPARRSRVRLVQAWLRPDHHPDSPTPLEQLPDWWRAGLPRLYAGLRSAIAVHLEEILPQVRAPITIVHGGSDTLSPHSFAAALAALGPALVEMPGAPHSWPVADPERFVDLVDALLR